MDDRRAGAKITNFLGATMCFMQMNDERIFNVFILQFWSSVSRLHANEALKLLFENRSVNIKAVWIWAIEDKQRLVIFQRAFQQVFK